MAEANDSYDEEYETDDDDDEMYDDYYDHQGMIDDPVFCEHREPDPEAFEYKCVDTDGAKNILKEEVDFACQNLKVRHIFVILLIF